MIDIETHKIIDIINSRDLEDVKQWLSTYKNLQVVSRDGSVTYKNAITLAHPSAIQISDRFHLLKNLTEYCKDYLKSKFKSKVLISEKIKTQSSISEMFSKETKNKHLTLKKKWEKANGLLSQGFTKNSICKQLNMDIRVFNKLLSLTNEELDVYFKNTLELRQEAKINKKMELVNKARDLYNNQYSMRKIAEILDIDRRTVKKYIDSNFTPTYTRRVIKKSILDPYKDDIHELYQKGNTSKTIYNIISKKGYSGSQSYLRHYCSKLKKISNENEGPSAQTSSKIKTVKRSILLKTLYKPIKDIKGLSDEVIKYVNERYPFFGEIIKLVTDFKEILKQKKIERLDEWLMTAKALNNSYINSFINGISRDIDAVKNAIIYDYNNGLAEGSVNKLKVIKRIMYGRSNFEMLRRKVLFLENNRKIN